MYEPTAPDADASSASLPRVDRLVVLRAAAYGLLLAVPAAIANSAWSGQGEESDGKVALSFLVVVAGWCVAGFVAGVNADREPLRHGAYAGLVAFVPVELFAISGRLDRGDPIRLITLIVHAAIAASVAMLYVRAGVALRARRARAAAEAPDAPHPTPQEGP